MAASSPGSTTRRRVIAATASSCHSTDDAVTEWLSFTVVGLVTGCVYALIATCLVVTYTTTGIFNFSHGSIGMIAAFTFWQLWQGWHVNAVLSLLLVLLVLGPLFGVIVEPLLVRPFYRASLDITLR